MHGLLLKHLLCTQNNNTMILALGLVDKCNVNLNISIDMGSINICYNSMGCMNRSLIFPLLNFNIAVGVGDFF